MAKATFWVLIETDEDNFGNPDIPSNADVRDLLRKGSEYGIIDTVRESDIEDIVLKPVK